MVWSFQFLGAAGCSLGLVVPALGLALVSGFGAALVSGFGVGVLNSMVGKGKFGGNNALGGGAGNPLGSGSGSFSPSAPTKPGSSRAKASSSSGVGRRSGFRPQPIPIS